MSAELIDGKAFAAGLRTRVAELAARFEAGFGRKAGLAVVLVGEDPASQVYVRSKGKQTVEAGMASFEYKLPADTSEADLLARVEALNADPAVDGILVQLPLPAHIDEQKVIATIAPDKDVDGFHPENIGRMVLGLDCFLPATPSGIVELLRFLFQNQVSAHAASGKIPNSLLIFAAVSVRVEVARAVISLFQQFDQEEHSLQGPRGGCRAASRAA